MADSDFILIVGAGPTGLTLANDLARRGVPFRIIDSKPGPSSDSKGLALSISSQYALCLIGLENAVGEQGNTIRQLNIHWKGKRYSRINFDQLKYNIKTLITQTQPKTEAELLTALANVGHEVHWSQKLVGIEEHNDQITVTIESESGDSFTAQYPYVVGCDGKWSVIREALDTTFEGIDYQMYFALGDFRLDWGFSSEEVQYFVYEDGFFILVPIGDNLWRIVVKYDGEMPSSLISASDITTVLKRYLGENTNFGDPIWLSRAPFYNRVAGCLNSERLFIAGDAAHLFSPIGGTGMNAGIQDAINLGWKLAFTYHGISNKSILKTYEHERLPAIRAAANLSDLSTHLISGGDWQHPGISNLAPTMKNRNNLRSVFPATHSGMALKINVGSKSNFLEENTFSGVGSLNPLYLYLHSLHRYLCSKTKGDPQNYVSCIIVLHGIELGSKNSVSLKSLRDRLLICDHLRVYYIHDKLNHTGLPHELRVNEQLIRMDKSALSQVSPNQADISIVRPDGITAYESSLLDESDIEKVFSTYFYHENVSVAGLE